MKKILGIIAILLMVVALYGVGSKVWSNFFDKSRLPKKPDLRIYTAKEAIFDTATKYPPVEAYGYRVRLRLNAINRRYHFYFKNLFQDTRPYLSIDLLKGNQIISYKCQKSVVEKTKVGLLAAHTVLGDLQLTGKLFDQTGQPWSKATLVNGQTVFSGYLIIKKRNQLLLQKPVTYLYQVIQL